MIHLRPEGFGPNVCDIDISPNFGFDSIFDDENIIVYKVQFIPLKGSLVDPFTEPALEPKVPLQLPFCYVHKNKVDIILAEQISFTRDEQIQHFLVG